MKNEKEVFEQKLKQVLSVPVPDNLAERIIAKTYQDEFIDKDISTGIVMFSAIVSVSFFSLNLHSNLEEKMLHEVIDHQDYFSVEIEVSEQTVNYISDKFDINKDIIQELKNINPCDYKNNEGFHFVFDDSNNQFIIHFFPTIEQNNEVFSNDKMKGIFHNTDKG